MRLLHLPRTQQGRLLLAGFVLFAAIATSFSVKAIGEIFIDEQGNTTLNCDILNYAATAPQCTGTRMRLKVGQTGRVPIQYVHVRAYFVPSTRLVGGVEVPNAPNGRYRVIADGADFCPSAGNATINNRDVFNSGWFENRRPARQAPITRYSISKNVVYRAPGQAGADNGLLGSQPYAAGVNQSAIGRYKAAAANCNALTFNVTNAMLTRANGVKTASGQQVYYVNFVARHIDRHYSGGNRCPIEKRAGAANNGNCDGLSNGFRVRQTGGAAGELFGVTSVGQNNGAGVTSYGVSSQMGNSAAEQAAQNGNINADFSYALRFGADCTIPAGSSRIVSAMFYDLDYGLGQTGGQHMRVALDRTASDGTRQHLARRAGTNDAVYERAAGGPTTPIPGRVGTWDAGHVAPANRLGTEAQGSFQLNSNNGGYSYITFRAFRGDIFTLYLVNTSPLVLNQYSLPFDAIYYKSPCTDSGSSFDLQPEVDGVTNGQVVEQGGSLNPTAAASNSGTDTTTADWQLSVAKYAPTNPANPPTAGEVDNTLEPCAYATNNANADSCTAVSPSSLGQRSFPAGSTSLASETFDVGNEPVGTKICFFASINRYDQANTTVNDWRHSAMRCAIVGKEPKLQVWGYDMKVLGSINTSTSEISSKTYGSWGEYGVLSNGNNTAMGSGNGLLDGNNSTAQQDWSDLTFANLPQFGSYGGVTLPIVSDNGWVPGPAALGARSYGANDRLVYRVVSGTLRINGNQTYNDGPYTSIGSIPQVIYFADNIIIDPDVTRIDPWLVANRISTCSTVNAASNYFLPMEDADLDSNKCDKPLKFNGPVVTNQIFLYRTGGDENQAAETFNLRADAFLSSLAGDGPVSPVATTDLVTELPPRF